SQPVGCRARSERLVFGGVECLAEGMLDDRFVVDNQNGEHQAAPTGSGTSAGSRTTTPAPPPERFAPVIAPPWSSTMRFDISRPRPNPVSFPVANGSKRRGKTSGEMPDPLSVTRSSTPSATGVTATLSVPP